ncbi:TerB family tellurite resistance protein [Gammaproteobacteria bacterium]|nr:TerB family tellurite resistance protein [Gammaproteobacteria bacterium]
MFNFFKKKKVPVIEKNSNIEIELTASLLAYEIARGDGDVSDSELSIILNEIKKITERVGKSEQEILKIIQDFSSNSISFHEFIEDINKDYSKEDKLALLTFLWSVAYADSVLEINEERLIRRIADLIHLKDMDVLKIKDKIKNS